MQWCDIGSRGSITENKKGKSEASEAFRDDELRANKICNDDTSIRQPYLTHHYTLYNIHAPQHG